MNFYQQLGFLVFGSRLKRLSENFLSDVNKIYACHNINFDATWFPVFYMLSKQKEISIKQISDELNISHPAASQLVSGLQQKGFIKSIISKKDARHKAVTFTAKGEKHLQKIKPVWTALEKAMIDLCNENAQSKNILKALTSIEKNIAKTSLLERVENYLEN